jgi:glyoxylase-like metal-dependent hydrolase (beta-lactamase superfamily II)
VVLYCSNEKVCFCGDLIFQGSVGRTDLPGGDWAALESSIRTQIYTLPADTRLLPGHGPETTVGQEMTSNPFVAA